MTTTPADKLRKQVESAGGEVQMPAATIADLFDITTLDDDAENRIDDALHAAGVSISRVDGEGANGRVELTLETVPATTGSNGARSNGSNGAPTPVPPRDPEYGGTVELPAAPTSTPPMPVKVCPKCSVQTATAGEFCPHCGSAYVKGRSGLRRVKTLSKRTRVIAAVILGLLLLGGAGAGIALKIQHDNQVKADQQAAADRAERAAAEQRAADAAAQADREAQQAADASERKARQESVKGIQDSITKDAKKDVNLGVIDGPILRSECQPVGGGSTDDLTAKTTKFECMAVNKENADGTSEGYRFAATMNWDDGSYTWHLGD